MNTSIKREAVIEAAEAIGFAMATIKAIMEPTGVTPDMCHEATERLDSARASLLEILND